MGKKKNKGVTVGLNELITQSKKLTQLPSLNSNVGRRTLFAVLQRLQGLFNLAKASEKDPQLYFNFETEDFEVKRKSTAGYNEGDVLFNLSLSDIAEPNHYPEVRAALGDLLNVHVLVPIPDEPGYFRTESFMQIKGEFDKDGKFVGTNFSVIVPRLAAENILDINLLGGYSRYLLYTASQLRSDYACTLYIRLSEEWRRHGNVFEIGYEDLRRNMGFVKEKVESENDKGKKAFVTIDHTNKHASWSLFCRYILDQTQQELIELSKRTPVATDFTFEYEGRLSGQPLPKYKRPDAVRFTIIPTSVGKQLSSDTAFASQSIRARRMMTKLFLLTEGQARTLMRRVTPDNVDELLQMMEDWRFRLDAGQLKWTNIPAAAWTSIDSFLKQPKAPETQTTSDNPLNDMEQW